MNQIEALKKELAMRDVLCGRAEPWVAELSRQQTAKTGKALLKYMSIVPDVAGIDAVDVPEIHSLAEARYMLGLAKSLLWEACERKESRLRAIVDLTREAVPPMKEVTEPEDSRPYASPMADALPLDAPAVEDQLLHSGDHTSETPQPAPISFEDFKTAAGADGQAKYNAAKQDLKIGKDKQRQLVRTINFQKGEIDRLNEIIQRCKQQELESGRVSDHDGAEVAAPEETGPRDNFEESLSLIEAAKKAYRDAHTELLVSKKEVEDLQLRKKKCLAEVMSSYQAYCGQVGQSTVDC